MKDYLTYEGVSDLVGSRDTIREAVSRRLLTESEGRVWMDMLQNRNRTSHLYDEETVRRIEETIVEHYVDAFVTLRNRMKTRAGGHD